jgi:pimeloyl-ACP methyl ester carboxylesterase
MAQPIIRKRRVFHVPGYDPAPASAVKRRFARELRRFEETWSVRAAVAQGADDEAWQVASSGPNWQVETQYRLVRWDDLIAEAGRRPIWLRIPQGLFAFLDFAVSALPQYLRANWRYAAFFLYPFLMFAVLAALAVFAGRFAANSTGYTLAGIVAAVAMLVLLWQWPGRRIYLHLLFDDWIFSRNYARHGDPQIEARLDRMAREMVEAATASDVDEIVVVGHSLGAVLAIDLLDRALLLKPDLGQSGARIALISVGSSILKIGLHAGAQQFRASVERVASAPGIFWGDYQALSDVMNFYKSDPLAAMGLAARDVPLVRMVRIRHMLDPAIYKRIRYHFLRMHLQFVSGNNRRNAYDYFMLICGPLTAERQVRGDGALSAIGTDGRLLEMPRAPA